MSISKPMKLALKALSYQEQTLEQSRRMVNLKAIDPLKKFYDTIDYKIYNGDYEVPIRIYNPKKNILKDKRIILFLHGGGWVTESVETYNKICKNMADNTGNIVIAVDYRLAPEHHFPIPLEDCYAVARELYLTKNIIDIEPDKITIVGDSAGGNLTSALCLMARDKGEFLPKQQILIYPCTNSDYTENTPFKSVIENGTDYLLTRKNMADYVNMYKSCDEDMKNPYFAPILAKNLKNQPKTLIVTSEFDPLRDEGEAYGQKLKEAGNDVKIYRIPNALHGFFALSTKYFHVKQLFEYINQFLKEGYSDEE